MMQLDCCLLNIRWIKWLCNSSMKELEWPLKSEWPHGETCIAAYKLLQAWLLSFISSPSGTNDRKRYISALGDASCDWTSASIFRWSQLRRTCGNRPVLWPVRKTQWIQLPVKHSAAALTHVGRATLSLSEATKESCDHTVQSAKVMFCGRALGSREPGRPFPRSISLSLHIIPEVFISGRCRHTGRERNQVPSRIQSRTTAATPASQNQPAPLQARLAWVKTIVKLQYFQISDHL